MKTYTVEKEIYGKKYIAQFSGLSLALRYVDETYIDGTNISSLQKQIDFLFKYVIVEPKNLTVDDFDDSKALNEVMQFGRGVMEGIIKPEK